MAVSATEAQMAISTASVVFSGVLVVVTYLYYQETKEHTEEMEAARKAEFKPVLKGTVEVHLAGHYRFVFQNTGNGAAHNVTAKWGFSHLDEEIEWKIPLITPGQRHTFDLPFKNGFNDISTENQIEDELEGEEGILYFHWKGTDALGNDIGNKEEIVVLETIRTRSGVERLPKSEQKKIRKELEDLNDNVSNIPRALQQITRED